MSSSDEETVTVKSHWALLSKETCDQVELLLLEQKKMLASLNENIRLTWLIIPPIARIEY